MVRTGRRPYRSMEGGSVDELLDVTVERPVVDQLQVEVGRTLEDRVQPGLTGDDREERHLQASTRPAAVSARFNDRLPCERNGTSDSSLSRATRSTATAHDGRVIDVLMSLYEPEAALIPQPGTVAEGTAAIRDSLRWFLDRGGQITVDTTLVLRVGDLALLANRWSLTGAAMPGGSPAALGATPAEGARPQAAAPGGLRSGH